jgi:hypothetical protein
MRLAIRQTLTGYMYYLPTLTKGDTGLGTLFEQSPELDRPFLVAI